MSEPIFHDDDDGDGESLLQALRSCAPERMSSTEIVEQGLVFDEEAVLWYVRQMMTAGIPICVLSGLSSDWEGLAIQGFDVWLSTDPKELAETRRMVDEHIAEMVGIKAGLDVACRQIHPE
jgi:hypothetical protein